MSEIYPHFIRHFAELTPLGFNEMLFTHAGLSYELTSSLYLDLAASGLTLYNKCRFIALNYNQKNNQTILIRYLPYVTYIKLRNPVSLSSKAKIRSTLNIRRYDVAFNQNVHPIQFRTTNYKDPEEFNLSPRQHINESTYTIANDGDLISSLQLAEPSQQVIKVGYTINADHRQESIQRVLGKLPTEKAYIYEISANLRDVHSIKSFNNQRISACKILLPSLEDGYIPASRVGHDMINKSPVDIAWALLYAISIQRPIYVLNILKGLVEETYRRQVIIQDSLNNYNVNSQAAWGFENNFIPGAPSYSSSRDIGDNALLGWSIVRAVNYLQDKVPLEDWSLDGVYSGFKKKLTQLILAQGYLCAYAVSRESWWCCEKVEANAYNYGVLSRRASYLTSLFLDELLQVIYNNFIHQQAARLYISLYSFEESSVNDEYFTDFNDHKLESVAYRGFWLWAKENKDEEAYNYLTTKYDTSLNKTTDALVSYCLSILKNKLQLENSLPEWVTAYRGDNQQAANGLYLPNDRTACHYLPVYLAIHNLDITNVNSFDLYALEALAKTSFTLSELRRFWPTGSNWGSYQVINNVNSILGSLLQADANLYFDYFLLENLIKNARSLSNCQGVYIKQWVDQLLKLDSSNLLISDQLLKKVLISFIQRQTNNRDSIVDLLQNNLGYPEATITQELPNPYSLIKNLEHWDDTFNDYTKEVNETSQYDYLNKEQVNSILYKPAQEQLASEDVTDCSATNKLSAYTGKALRRVAGFPYRNVPISFSYPNTSLDLPINQEYSDLARVSKLMYPPGTELSNDKLDASYSEWINNDMFEIDGTALIKPLSNYIPKVIFRLKRVADRYLKYFLETTISAGVDIQITAANHYADYPNTFYVFSASSLKWRIDNLNLFNNEDYDNDSY